MEEPKNLNNPPVDQSAAAAPKNIPTVAGALIILIVAVIVGAGVFYILQTDFSGNSYSSTVVPGKSLKSKTETAETSEIKKSETIAETQVAEETAAEPATGETFNFDYELKKLDDQNNSISSDDFNENEMSDVNIGI